MVTILRHFGIVFIILSHGLIIYAQETVSAQFYSASIDTLVSVEIYLPDGYTHDDNQLYRSIIYLPTAYGHAGHHLIPLLDDAHDSIEVSEAAVIFSPTITSFANPNYSNYHFYYNSIYHGDLEDVIVKDLLSWIAAESEDYNFSEKISQKAEHMAIAGVGMGGEAAHRIALTHPDIFSVAAGIGTVPSYAPEVLEFIRDLIRSESCENGICFYDYSTAGFVTSAMFEISSVFSPIDSNGNFELLLNSGGEIREEIAEVWREKADLSTIILNQGIYHNIPGPFLYLEVKLGHLIHLPNELFIQSLSEMNVPQEKYHLELYTGELGFNTGRIAKSLAYTYDHLAPIQTTRSRNQVTPIRQLKVAPNPTSSQTVNISTTSGDLPQKFELSVTDLSGKQMIKDVVNNPSMMSSVSLSLQALNSGIYFIRLENENSNYVAKIVLN